MLFAMRVSQPCSRGPPSEGAVSKTRGRETLPAKGGERGQDLPHLLHAAHGSQRRPLQLLAFLRVFPEEFTF